MQRQLFLTSIALALFVAGQAPAETRYVNAGATNAIPPFTNWSTAATTIQDAIDAAADGDLVLVTNGVYATGGRLVNGALTNRVVVNKQLTVRSVNGPETTRIQGYQVPGTINSNAAVRCVYLASGACLTGFTVTKGATRWSVATNDGSGGGIWCESTGVVVSNCVIVGNASRSSGGGVYSGMFQNCHFLQNTNIENDGGGAFSAVLVDCTLEQNDFWGAGACILSNCVLAANWNAGAKDCVLSNCLVTGNHGSGLVGGTAWQCVISSNTTAPFDGGGGAFRAVLDGCVLFANSAFNGGGAYNCVLNGCVLSNNVAENCGGGVLSLTNAPGNDNILIGNSAGGAGGGFYSSAMEIDRSLDDWTFIGNSAGGDGGGMCTVFTPAAALNGFTFANNSSGANGGGLYALGTTALLCTNCSFEGNTAAADGGGAYNVDLIRCSLTGNQAANGGGAYGKSISDSLISDNHADANGGGMLVTLGTKVSANCLFTNNSAQNGGGIYNMQALTLSNCVFVSNSATANGGGCGGASPPQSYRCVFGTNAAAFGGGGYSGSYTDCLITNNIAWNSGGGIYIQLPPGAPGRLTNCTVALNWAGNAGGGLHGGNLANCALSGNRAGTNGGGAAHASLGRCVVTGNQAGAIGGGAFNSSLTNCLIIGNSAMYGGGAHGSPATFLQNNTIVANLATNAGGGLYFTNGSTVTGCIIYYNTSASGPNHSGALAYYHSCCTTPLPGNSTATLTNEPAFAAFSGGNLRLQTGSLCINNGYGNAGTVDLDGRGRVVDGIIDMGAYEYQGAGMSEFIAWLQFFGLPVNGSADYTDADADWSNNWQEWRAGTVPTNELSVLKILSISKDTPGATVTWQSVEDVMYVLERSTNLAAQPRFSAIQSNVIGEVNATSFTDTSAGDFGPFFYRVKVQ